MALDTVPLGETGLKVSEIAFGTWRFGREDDEGEVEIKRGRAYDLLDAYADYGGRFIDTADSYGDGFAEDIIGDWLQNRDREDYVIASKIYWPTREGDPNGRGLNRKHLRRQMARILDRLETDYLDLLYVHRWDDDTPAEEFMRTLDGFVDDGRVNYLGTSTEDPNAWKVVKANEIARREGYEPFTVAQPRYNLVDREIEGNYAEMCEAYGIGVVPWSPLAGGFLTGKYQRDAEPPADSRAARERRFADRYLTDANFDVLDELEDVAAEVGEEPARVALAWLLHRDDVTAPIVGARTVDQLTADLQASDVSLTDEQVVRLTESKG
ncbi:aldo/keto reductase [Haloarchaeobius sp. HRN-SO-5]|uniref:aldo/keto reductase n=1 Tax=Haloarchaeobius sp. HRN-SO-5 TaxID=3446118 RepID=UPI003EBC37FE